METQQLLFDKLAFVDRLIKSGIDEQQARAFSDAFEEALRESVATKTDIAELRTTTSREIAEVELEIRLLSRDLTIRMGRHDGSVVWLAACDVGRV